MKPYIKRFGYLITIRRPVKVIDEIRGEVVEEGVEEHIEKAILEYVSTTHRLVIEGKIPAGSLIGHTIFAVQEGDEIVVNDKTYRVTSVVYRGGFYEFTAEESK